MNRADKGHSSRPAWAGAEGSSRRDGRRSDRCRSSSERLRRDHRSRLPARRHRHRGGRQLQPVLADATAVDLLLFDREDDARPSRVIRSTRRRTGPTTTGTCSCPACRRAALRLPRRRAVGPGERAAVRSRQGPARSVRPRRRRAGRLRPRGRATRAARTPHCDEERRRRPGPYDWEGTSRSASPRRARSSTRCTSAGSPATRAPGVGEETGAPIAGLIEKIPYLKELGITAVELLPVFAVRRAGCARPGCVNYWGYQPVSFFAPHPAYS